MLDIIGKLAVLLSGASARAAREQLACAGGLMQSSLDQLLSLRKLAVPVDHPIADLNYSCELDQAKPTVSGLRLLCTRPALRSIKRVLCHPHCSANAASTGFSVMI